MGSTTFCESAAEADVMHSGSTTAVTRSRVSGAALAIRNAQARPAMTAKWNGRASGCLSAVVATIQFLLKDSIRRHCEERSDEAIQLSCCGNKAGLLRFARNDGGDVFRSPQLP